MKSHFLKIPFNRWCTAASYAALLLLIMPPSASGILKTGLILLLGLVPILWRLPNRGRSLVSVNAFTGAGLLLAAFGLRFYDQWLYSSKVQTIANLLHLPSFLLTAAATLFLCLAALVFVSGILQKAMNMLIQLTSQHPFVRDMICCVMAAFVTVLLAQTMSAAHVFSMGFFRLILGVLIVSVTVLILHCICGNIKISLILGTAFFLFLATVNVYVYAFRGRLFEPVDVFAFGTAMNVADNYALLPIPHSILFGWLTWLGVQLCTCFVCSGKKARFSVSARAVLALLCLACSLFIWFYTGTQRTYHWGKEGAKYNGYILDFVSKIREAYVAKPDGYDPEVIAEAADRYAREPAVPQEAPPHIIVIMDEAFSDLSVYGEISTNTEVTPFLSSLREDVISGYALASVFGGNTANSEFEFLTGNSMAWLSPSSVPYQQYMNDPSYSMVSWLKQHYGYRCVAMHPYLSSSWNRPNTYRQLGFDESLFIEDFPQEHYIRQYISDREMFETIVDVYENTGDSPLFLFGVSMQNHGNYYYEGENYTQTISLNGLQHKYPAVEQYLSLIHETDKALEYLFSYFDQEEEEVLILVFGDHQPSLGTNFYAEISHADPSSPENQLKRYLVPFYIWANYDIPEKEIARTSLNYLSGYLYEAAGIPLPPYNRFLSEMETEIPAVNANGYYSAQKDSFLSFDEATGEEKVWLSLYEQLQYNNLFDKKDRNEQLFPLPQQHEIR